jgi:hypothetical protein
LQLTRLKLNREIDSCKCSHAANQRIENAYLLLNLVSSSEHAVDVGEVVGSWEEAVDVAFRLVVLLQVRTLAEVAHLQKMSQSGSRSCSYKTYLVVDLRGNNTAVLEAVLDIKLLLELGDAACDFEREHGGSKSATVAEHANALASGVLTIKVGKE